MTCSYGLRFKGKVFLVLQVVIFNVLCCDSEVVEANSNFGNKIFDVKRKIDHLTKHAVKSIKSEDGDIIDCIDIYKQPAFDHPALKNHTIQMAPSYDPTVERATTRTEKGDHKKEETHMKNNVVPQLWQKNGSCPKGTVPIRRIRETDLLNASSIEDYGRKKPEIFLKINHLNGENRSNTQLANHSMAKIFTYGFNFLGAKGDIRVWNPNVEADNEYSTSRLFLATGPYFNFEAIESGWAVNPSVYGDRQTRLFTYWTVDSSKTTGCFDVTCPGFVQTSREIALGAAFNLDDDLPWELSVSIVKDLRSNNWWVQHGGVNIGYWPQELFSALSHTAENVEWGGDVYSFKLGETTPHTATEMGSGRFPETLSGYSGYVKRMLILDNSLSWKFPQWVSYYADEYYCYNFQYTGGMREDTEFYYGGPGRNEMCV